MVGYFRNNSGVTMLTRLSVHCAERMVATRSSQALEWCKAQVAPGYILSSVARSFLTRAARSAAVFGLATGFGKPHNSICARNFYYGWLRWPLSADAFSRR